MSKFLTQLVVTTLLFTGCTSTTLNTFADTGHHSPSTAPTSTPPSPQDGHSEHNAPSDHGHHARLEIPAGQAVPTVSLEIYSDPVAGWNLEVKTQNWTFAPEHVNQSSLPTEGHAHLYLNGEKLTRLYGSWYYLSSLPPGNHTLTVGLNANGHETLMHNGEPIEASVTVTVPHP